MKPGTPVTITAGVIANMSIEQFISLRDNICAEGMWENADDLHVSGHGEYIGVVPRTKITRHGEEGLEASIFIGIEKDGYTHS